MEIVYIFLEILLTFCNKCYILKIILEIKLNSILFNFINNIQ